MTEAEYKTGQATPIAFHPASLGICPDQCTLKPPVPEDVFKLLVELYMKDGVVTGSEPLLVQFVDALVHKHGPPSEAPPTLGDSDPFGMENAMVCSDSTSLVELWNRTPNKQILPCMVLGYVKGWNRSQTLMGILFWLYLNMSKVRIVFQSMMDAKLASGEWALSLFGSANAIDVSDRLVIESLHPIFHSSACALYAHQMVMASKVDEGCFNMAFNVMSSVRKPPNVLVHLHVVQKLQMQHGLVHYSSFVKSWNAKVIRSFCIVGKKAMVLKLLMEHCPHAVQALIVKHCAKLGWVGSVWSEDALATKKLYPGHQFPAKNKLWLVRLKTTEQSTLIAIQRLQVKHEQSPSFLKKKKTPDEVEKVSEMAAAIANIAVEVVGRLPVAPDVIHKGWVLKWATGCMVIDQEISSLMFEKSELMDPLLHIPSLKELIDAQPPVALLAGSRSLFTNSVGQSLEVDEFKLVLKKLQFDVKAFQIWGQKMQHVKNALWHGQLEFKMQRQATAVEAVTQYMDQYCLLLNVEDMMLCSVCLNYLQNT